MKKILSIFILFLGLKATAQDSVHFALPNIYSEIGYSEFNYNFQSSHNVQLYPPDSRFNAFDLSIGAKILPRVLLESRFNQLNHDPEIEYITQGNEPVTLTIGIGSKVENLRIGINYMVYYFRNKAAIYTGAGIKLMHSTIYSHGYSTILQNAQQDTVGSLNLLFTSNNNTIIATYVSLSADIKIWKWLSAVGSVEYDQGYTPLYTAYWSMTDYSSGNIYQSSYSYTGSEFLIRVGLRFGI